MFVGCTVACTVVVGVGMVGIELVDVAGCADHPHPTMMRPIVNIPMIRILHTMGVRYQGFFFYGTGDGITECCGYCV